MQVRRAITTAAAVACLALAGVACDAEPSEDGAEPGGDPGTTGVDTAEPGDEVGDEGGALPEDTELDDPTGAGTDS